MKFKQEECWHRIRQIRKDMLVQQEISYGERAMTPWHVLPETAVSDARERKAILKEWLGTGMSRFLSTPLSAESYKDEVEIKMTILLDILELGQQFLDTLAEIKAEKEKAGEGN